MNFQSSYFKVWEERSTKGAAMDSDKNRDISRDRDINNSSKQDLTASLLRRELDPALFGGSSNFGSLPVIGGYANSNMGGQYGLAAPPPQPTTQPGHSIPLTPNTDLKVLEAQMGQLRVVLNQYERKFDELTAKQNELVRDSQGRLDRLDSQVLRLEGGIERLTHDTSERLATLAARLNERKVSDAKVQDLMDRHNLLVRNFENRLSAMQKLAADQEQALLSAFAALEDARAELARLKRPY